MYEKGDAFTAWYEAVDALTHVDIVLGQVPGEADASAAFSKLMREFRERVEDIISPDCALKP